MKTWEAIVNGACYVAVVVFGLALLAGWLDWWPA